MLVTPPYASLPWLGLLSSLAVPKTDARVAYATPHALHPYHSPSYTSKKGEPPIALISPESLQVRPRQWWWWLCERTHTHARPRFQRVLLSAAAMADMPMVMMKAEERIWQWHRWPNGGDSGGGGICVRSVKRGTQREMIPFNGCGVYVSLSLSVCLSVSLSVT